MADHEEFDRLCEECHEKEACYTVSVMMGDQMTQRHLCEDCMAKMNMSIAAGNVKHLLSAILTAITGADAPDAPPAAEEPPVPDVICERCQTTLSQFTKSGRLGCPGCYKAFQEQLTPMLQQIHGRVQHAGRKPLHSEAAQRQRSQHEELMRQMEQAVAVEDFETAAILRDRLRALAQKEGEA